MWFKLCDTSLVECIYTYVYMYNRVPGLYRGNKHNTVNQLQFNKDFFWKVPLRSLTWPKPRALFPGRSFALHLCFDSTCIFVFWGLLSSVFVSMVNLEQANFYHCSLETHFFIQNYISGFSYINYLKEWGDTHSSSTSNFHKPAVFSKKEHTEWYQMQFRIYQWSVK